ncbi:TadA family conjugal transfer-associated ATPase [Corynebacterium sp. HMSC27B11]|uniref:TadA family conjugal transfer-associated ATPase n=1 Tax=Corynebacterium sp. HMSC27B11 TaxID=1581065 RepID=UPI0008A157A1|nr:TadA family conjugal transfer-associated ATPase [Corynebacterium sp. HMSC27B11]OFS18452.1 type II/IV secretion system protein [Corynebacterium sp. HMSC27B11]
MWIADGLNKLRLIPGGAEAGAAGEQGAATAVAVDNSLLDKVRHELAVRGARRASEAEILSAMEAVTGATSYDNIPDTVRQLRDIQRELSGLGVLAEVLAEPGVTDVVVNPDGAVWADRGRGAERTPVSLAPPEVRELAVRLAAVCGVRLDDARPFADGIIDDLPPGIPAAALRVHAMLSPPARGGACVSLRTLTRGRLGLEDLCEAGMMPVAVRDMLRRLVLARKNLLVTGGTGTGKTTLLAALLGEVPERERIVLVEDTPELMPTHPHVVALAAREGNADGAGEIGMQLLLRQCLRMRPDRIVVGEVRGAEVADLLVALNTGHAGSAGTMHANSVAAVPGRLAALGAMAGMSPEALQAQATDGIDVVVHLERAGGRRRVATIAVTERATEEMKDGLAAGTSGTAAAGTKARGLRLRPVWDGRPLDGWEGLP